MQSWKDEMLKISGLDALTKELDEAQKALTDLDGTLGTISFNPNDPSDIERAVKELDMMVDQRAGRSANNSIVGPVIEGIKEQYRLNIFEQAAAARLKSEP